MIVNELKVTCDFETRSRHNLRKSTAYEYSKDPSTIVTCFAIKPKNGAIIFFPFNLMQRPFKMLPERFQNLWIRWVLDGSVTFNAHNAFFEQCIYNNILVKRLGWPAIALRKWRCTAAKAAAVAIPRNLADAGAVMRLRMQKDFEGHRVMMKLCKPTAAHVKWKKQMDKYIDRANHEAIEQWECEEPKEFYDPEDAPEDYQKLYDYCKKDVLSEEELDESLPDLSHDEQELWFIDQKINLRGVQVDMPLVNRIATIMREESRTMNKDLDILTMGLVSSGNARAQILDFLSLEGIEMPDLKAKTVDEFLANGKATGDAKKLLEIRRALSKASTAKYQKFQLCAASDGRVRDILLYSAASTRRWGGKNVQPQNFPRGVIKDVDEAIHRIETCDVEDLKLLYGKNLMPLFSSVLRGMFIASPGKELFVEDLNAIETRVLWWLAGHKKGLEMFATGEDPYRALAAAIFNKPILEVTDEERQVGKAAVLGCGYQMGFKKFITSAWDVYRARVTLEVAKIAVAEYRKVHFPVTELWANYERACIFAIENPGTRYRVGLVKFFVRNSFLWIELPSGGRIAYKDPSVEWSRTLVMTKGEDTIYCHRPEELRELLAQGYEKTNEFNSKKIRYFAVNQKAKKADCVIPKWTREATYGGKIVENVVQAVARDVLAHAIVKAEGAGFDVLMHSHDELVSEATIGTKKHEDYKKIMQTAPPWAAGLPLKSGGWVGPRYKKG